METEQIHRDSRSRHVRVGISGSYGGLNLGDEAILESIVTQLRQSLLVEITVFSRDPEDTLGRHDVEHALPVRDLSREEIRSAIQELDILILGGGGILFDAEANTYLREVGLAEEHGIPVMIYAISAGPLQDGRAQQLVRKRLNNADLITVRERDARKVLEGIGVAREIHVTADPALLLEPEPLPVDALAREGLDPGRRMVGFSLREPGPAAPELKPDHYHALLANTADYIVDRFDSDVVFVPMEPRVLDVQHAHAVVARMAHARRAVVLKNSYRSTEMLSLVGHFEFAVGMRLHFLIFAALQGVPFVALPYAGKVAGFLEALGGKMPPMQQVNPGKLIAHVDRSWDHREQIREQIATMLPALRDRARETHRMAIDLIEEKTGVKRVVDVEHLA